jgi:cation diffusion facilitator CzcD-associated flavoprotein CzcO
MVDLLIVGAGPYGLAAARAAQRLGIDVAVLGRPMSFWREHMPAEMFLRSGPDWHLDPTGELTLQRYLAARGINPADVDPLPVGLFLEYADRFTEEAGIAVRDEEVVRLDTAPSGAAASAGAGGFAVAARGGRHGRELEPRGFVATLASGATIAARTVVAAPGIARFTVVPEWGAGLGEHTCDLVDFASLSGARVLIVGGRQSAYEWAALIGEHGAERVDLVHRHDEPRFARVSWAFADPHMERTLAVPGWWRRLPAAEREAIGRRFWEVGRLTLEHWLEPRLARLPIRRRPGVEVVAASPAGEIRLSDGARLHADKIVFACGYRAALGRVPYLGGLDLAVTDGFPDLDESFGASVPGLYLPGFPATRDFGPFFGFIRGAVPAATIIARDLEARLA